MASHTPPHTCISVRSRSVPPLRSVSLLPCSVSTSCSSSISWPISIVAGSGRWLLKRRYAQPKDEVSNLKAGVAVYKPRSYDVLVADAARSLAYGLQDGKTRLEIDFPPLPSSISSYKGSSDEFIDANIQLVLAAIRKLQEIMETKPCIVFPDKPEKHRASRLFRAALDTINGVSLSSLDDVPSGPMTSFFKSIRNTLDFDFADYDEDYWKWNEPPSLFVFINCSTRDLSLIEKYVMDLHNTSFTVQLGRRANIHLANVVINTGDAGVTIQFGSVDFLAVAVANNPPLEAPAYHTHQPMQRRRATGMTAIATEVLRKRVSVFERLYHFDVSDMKRTISGQKISVALVNATTLPVEPFAQGRHDVEASSFGGKLTKRQRRRRNVELRAQQLSPGLFVTQPALQPKPSIPTCNKFENLKWVKRNSSTGDVKQSF